MFFPNGRLALWVALISLVFGCLTVVTLRLTAYSRLYDFDPRVSQFYPMAERAAAVMEVNVVDSQFSWPGLAADIDTVFMTLEVSSTLRGRWVDPYIQFEYNGHSERQYLARNSHGIRHIDLTSLIARAEIETGGRVDIIGHGVVFKPEKIQISGFRNPDAERKEIVVLSPHPDDAELAAFGLYSQAKSTIVTVTAGDAGTNYYRHLFTDKRDQSLVLGTMRIWDSIVVPMIGGVVPSNAVNLGYFDGSLAKMYKSPDKPVASSRGGLTDISSFRQLNLTALDNRVAAPRWDDLVTDLEVILQQVSPKIVVAPHPFIDVHSDHRFTTIALCEALQTIELQDAMLFLYMNYGIYSRNFPHGPRTSLRALPPWFERPFPFASIYSHALTERESALKAIALEAMRDFREFDMRPRVSVGSQLRSLLTSAWGQVSGFEHRRKGNFRYASRPNEIFFLASPAEVQDICDDFLVRWGKGDFGHYQ